MIIFQLQELVTVDINCQIDVVLNNYYRQTFAFDAEVKRSIFGLKFVFDGVEHVP